MSTDLRVLVVEDSATDAEIIIRELRKAGFDPEWQRVETEASYMQHLHAGLDLVLADFELPQFNGLRALELLKDTGLDVPFILVTGTIGEEAAVVAMKLGAADFLLKDRLKRLGAAVTHALEETRLRRERRQIEEALQAAQGQFRQLLEHSPAVLYAVKIAGETITPYLSSENITRLLGFTVAETLSMEWWLDHIHPEDLERALASIGETMTHNTNVIEYRMRHKDGSYRWVADNRRFVGNKDGTSGELVGTWTDITARKQSELALEQVRERLILATDAAHIGIWDWDVVANVLVWDARMFELHGIREQDFRGADSWLAGMHPDDRARSNAALAAAIAGEDNFSIGFRVVWPNGEVHYLEGHALMQRAANGAVTRMIGVSFDVTERRLAEIRINYLNRVLAMLTGINTLIVRVSNRDQLFTEACNIAVTTGGFRAALIGVLDPGANVIVPVASAGQNEELLASFKLLVSTRDIGSSTMAARAIREKKPIVSNDSQHDPQVLAGDKYADCGIRSMALFPLIVAGKAVGGIALYASEIEFFQEDEMKLLTDLAGDIAFAIDHIGKQERLDYVAGHDLLTGLANRSLFIERLAEYERTAAAGNHKLALFLLDLERLRNINDSLGWGAGDNLLREVAERLTRTAGNANLLARLGADQFVMVLPVVKQDGDMSQFLEKVIKAFHDYRFRVHEAEFQIVAKYGIAIFPDDGTSEDVLLKNAEAALKKAKESGARYLFYTQNMNDRIAGKLLLENRLRQALENAEFVLHYQPKVNLMTGKVTSAEALIRWNDPSVGLVPPGQFIPILEETGLIHEVGRWALRKAIEDYLRWRSMGLSAVRIAVNVSALQLRSPGFVKEIIESLGVSAHAAAGVELEITESLIMEDVRNTMASLKAIRALGVTIAIDDFGTGFSSLSYLSKLPLDSIKIDRSFVIDMTSGPQGLALVSTIINLARALKLKVVAEGVETDEQSHLLRLLNCDEMQGFLFSSAVPVEVFEAKFLTAAQVN